MHYGSVTFVVHVSFLLIHVIHPPIWSKFRGIVPLDQVSCIVNPVPKYYFATCITDSLVLLLKDCFVSSFFVP